MWALKVSLIALAAMGGEQDKTLDGVWQKAQARAVMLQENGQAKGFAMLVDQRGYFVAHQSALPKGIITGTSQGKFFDFRVISSDPRSQLVLLGASNWSSDAKPLRIAASNPKKGSRLIAVTLEGPFSAELAADDLTGLQNQTGRYVPFNEIRIETPSRRLGGAWILNNDGEIVGIIGAALQSTTNNSQRAPSNSGMMQAKADYGPGDLLVTYSLPVDVLTRVVDGFLSAKHQPTHPELGIEFVDAKGTSGAMVRSIVVGGAAHQGGVQMGDIITAVNGKPTARATQLAAQLFRLEPGSKVKLSVNRNGEAKELTVKVGEVVGLKLARLPQS